MCQVKKERLILVLPDKLNGTRRIVGRKTALVCIVTYHLIPVVSRKIRKIEYLTLLRMKRPHIIRVRQTIIFIKAIL